jgi:hypothetical protein
MLAIWQMFGSHLSASCPRESCDLIVKSWLLTEKMVLQSTVTMCNICGSLHFTVISKRYKEREGLRFSGRQMSGLHLLDYAVFDSPNYMIPIYDDAGRERGQTNLLHCSRSSLRKNKIHYSVS